MRTGLGAALEIPKTALIAACDRVLRLRLEVQRAVGTIMAGATPDKMDQFNLLIQDYRSIRKLADETLNDERVVTAENADLLLEAMRQATIAEEKAKLQKEYTEQQEQDRQKLTEAQKTIQELGDNLRQVRDQLEADKKREVRSIDRAIISINARMERLEVVATGLLLGLALLAIINYWYDWPGGAWWWVLITAAAGLAGLYHLIAHLLQRPILGLSGILTKFAHYLFIRRLARMGLEESAYVQQIETNRGRIGLRRG